MIPSHLSLVPFCPARRAAMEAIAEVERRRSRGVHGVSVCQRLFPPPDRSQTRHSQGNTPVRAGAERAGAAGNLLLAAAAR